MAKFCTNCGNELTDNASICIKCGKDSSNYVNGVSRCYDCCKETNTCRICGKEFY